MGTMVYYYKTCADEQFFKAINLLSNNSFNLPRGAYLFIDLYCDNPDCECKNGMVEIHKISLKSVRDENAKIVIKKPPLATLKASWEDLHADWNFEIASSRQSYNTAIALLAFFREAYKRHLAPILRQHYLHFRQAVRNNTNTINSVEEKIKPPEDFNAKIGRNDPCPCGSGKKYKKCCLAKEM